MTAYNFTNFDWDSSLQEAAEILAVINPIPLATTAEDFVSYMKSQTIDIMNEIVPETGKLRDFTHWGTGGFYITAWKKSDGRIHATATLMPYTVGKALAKARRS